MLTALCLILFGAVGFAVWYSILHLSKLYEEHTPQRVQNHLYKVAKDFPKLVINLGLSLLFWIAVGAIALRLLLTPLGFAELVPPVSASLPVVGMLVALMLLTFWRTPHRGDPPPKPRGRSLNSAGLTANQKKPKAAPAQRGRTIRSYHDLL